MNLFMTQDLIDTMAMETNRYAEAEITKQRPLRRSSHLHQWKDVSSQEMRCFIAVMLHMGHVKHAHNRKLLVTRYRVQIFFFVKSLNRFKLIL